MAVEQVARIMTETLYEEDVMDQAVVAKEIKRSDLLPCITTFG